MKQPTIDFDITWANPSEAQAQAFNIAMKLTKGRGMKLGKHDYKPLTEWELAEFICLASKSLWYHQAKEWTNKPPVKNEPEATIIKKACQFIVDVVDSGYDAENKLWWNMKKYDKPELLVKYILLADFMNMVGQLRQNSLLVISSGFNVFANIQLGAGYEKRFSKLMASRAAKIKKGEVNNDTNE